MKMIVEEEERLAEKRTPLPKPPPIKTDVEKEALRNKMKDKVSTFMNVLQCGGSIFSPESYCYTYDSYTVL